MRIKGVLMYPWNSERGGTDEEEEGEEDVEAVMGEG